MEYSRNSICVQAIFTWLPLWSQACTGRCSYFLSYDYHTPRISSGPTPTQSQYCLLFAGLLRNENVFRVRSMAPNPPFYLPLHSGYSVDLRVHVDRDGVWAAGWKIRSGLQSWYERRSPRFTDFYCFLTIKPCHILGQQTQSKCQTTTETFLGVTLLNLRNGRSAIF